MNQDLGSQNLNYFNNLSASENTEGGLNFTEIKNIILRRLPLIAGCTLSITALALLKILTTPPNYVAGFELLSEPVNIETKVTSTDDSSGKTREEIANVELDEVQLKILKSPRLIMRVIKPLQDKYPELNYRELTGELTIEIISDSQNKQNILQVEYQNSDQQKVSDVIATLTQTYIDYSVEKRQSGAKRGITFLDRQIPKVSQQSKEIENKIRELRIKHNFINPDASLERITVNIDNLTQERQKIGIELQELQVMLNNLEQELTTLPANSTTAIELGTPRYLELLNQMRVIDVEISRKSVVFQPNSMEMQRLNQEKQEIIGLIRSAGSDIRQKLENQIKTLENRQSNITREIENLKSKVEEWSTISINYNNLQQKLTLANDKLNEFILQKDALQIDAAQQEAPWQLLTPAQEPTSDNISTVNLLLLSSTLGLMLGVGASLLLDKQQRIIYTPAKVEMITNVPIIGTIPYSSKSRLLSFIKTINFKQEIKKLTPQKNSLQVVPKNSLEFVSPSIEAFRSFAANLSLLNFNNNSEIFNQDNNIKSLAITSAISREGKSTVTLNLARASASIGKRVLIVDTDLRSTKNLTKILGLESEEGLRNILDQVDPQLQSKFIKKLPLEENLFILTSGFNNVIKALSQEDPSRLLASEKMHLLMEKLTSHFDLVIYDLCSIIGFADVNLLSTKIDGIVVVTGLGKIQTMALVEALNQLKLCKAPILGVAVNKLVNKS